MDDDDFDFSDPDLDDLPANTLQQLETTAIRATQHHSHAANDSDYGPDDGVEVINLDHTAGAPRFGHQGHDSGYYAAHHDDVNTGYGEAMEVEEQEQGQELYQEPPRQSQADVDKLLQRVKKLEQEKRRLMANVSAANTEANKKAGEVDNLRRRGEAANREADKRRAALEREYKQTIEGLQAERDGFKRQLEQTKIHNEFDEHDARREGQMRRPRNPIPSRPKAAPANSTTTPKKAQKNIPLGDGFGEENILMASPSKRREKSKAATPKQANKRKRQITNDSPIRALQLSEPRERPKAPEPAPPVQEKLDVALLRNLWKDDSRFTLVHRLLSLRSSNGTDRVLEALVQHAFPSQPHKKLSSMAYDSLSFSRLASNVHELALHICRVFLTLWKQCLRETYYAPVYLILDALHFILACEPAKVAIDLTEEMMPLIVESIKLVAMPVHEASKNRDERKIAALFSPAQRTIASEIQAQDCLELLYLVATSCVSSPTPEALNRFWRTVPYDIVFLLLKEEQPLAHVTMMLRILSTSALASSLGPIDSEDPAGVENVLIIRLTNLFSRTVAPIPDPQGPSPKVSTEMQTWQLRLDVLGILTQFSVPEHGAIALAHNKLCIGRLVNYLNHCITSLYTRPLSRMQSQKIASINATMRLLHHLYMSTEVQIKAKLNDTLGGQHAFHVSMTRLAFSEGLVLEAGIDPEVMDMAHDILNDGMGPEEGDELMQVFPSGNSV